METIKIQIPKGYTVVSFDKVSGEIKFKEKPKDVMERIKTVDDILSDHGTTMDELDKLFKKLPEHLKYQHIAELLCEILNEGWAPDWSDTSQYKYFPWFEMGGSSGFRYLVYDDWRSASTVGSRLCLKSSELASYVGKQFTDIYEKFMLKN